MCLACNGMHLLLNILKKKGCLYQTASILSSSRSSLDPFSQVLEEVLSWRASAFHSSHLLPEA